MNAWQEKLLLALILLAALGLRLAPWGDNRFLEDEALYGYWGLRIATGADPMLDDEPVDKPPLFPYLVALSYLATGYGDGTATGQPADLELPARLPSLVASLAAVALVYRLGRALYGDRAVGLVAAGLLALSPFDILFASTAFTDPMMTALVLGGLLAAASGHPGAAGVLAGLAAATKQQGLFFLPLVGAVGLLPGHRFERRGWLRFAAAFVAVAAAVVAWDLWRVQRPGFFAQAVIAYGGLGPAEPQALGERARAWLQLVGGFWGWGVLAAAGAAWAGVLLARPGGRARLCKTDGLLAGFVGLFLAGHWLVGFQVWDRYLLGLVPLLALLAARGIVLLGRAINTAGWRAAYAAAAGAALLALLAGPVAAASQSDLPYGGDHGAYDGIDGLAGYIREQVPPGAVLYHYWLGHHHRFYLYGAPLRLHWYPDPADLARDATIYRREPRYIAFPSFRDARDARSALAGAGIDLVPLYEARRRDGSVSFVLYRMEGPAPS